MEQRYDEVQPEVEGDGVEASPESIAILGVVVLLALSTGIGGIAGVLAIVFGASPAPYIFGPYFIILLAGVVYQLTLFRLS